MVSLAFIVGNLIKIHTYYRDRVLYHRIRRTYNNKIDTFEASRAHYTKNDPKNKKKNFYINESRSLSVLQRDYFSFSSDLSTRNLLLRLSTSSVNNYYTYSIDEFFF